MAEKLLAYYRFIGNMKGFSGKIELARATNLPSIRAAWEPDSPETLEVFRSAIESLTGQEAPQF